MEKLKLTLGTFAFSSITRYFLKVNSPPVASTFVFAADTGRARREMSSRRVAASAQRRVFRVVLFISRFFLSGEVRFSQGNWSGRPYMPPLRVNFIRGCRGGLYIRPEQVCGSRGSCPGLERAHISCAPTSAVQRVDRRSTPTGWRGTVVLIPSGMALPCHLPLGTKGRQFLDSAAADDGEDFAVEILQGDGAVGAAVRCVGAEVAQQEHASLGDAVWQGQRV